MDTAVCGAVALGGAAGSLSRYLLGLSIQRLSGSSAFPWGTLCVNVSGAFLMGLLLHCAAAREWSPALRLGLTTGVLGGYTTFSAFSQESVGLLQAGSYRSAAAYMAASVGLCLLGVILGQAAGRWLAPLPHAP